MCQEVSFDMINYWLVMKRKIDCFQFILDLL